MGAAAVADIPAVNEALVHATDRRHVVRVVVGLQGPLVEIRADWCHRGGHNWFDVPRDSLRQLVAQTCGEIATTPDLWTTVQVVARYVNDLADRDELYELTGCTA